MGMTMTQEHVWSGWPGCYCIHCGQEEIVELACSGQQDILMPLARCFWFNDPSDEVMGGFDAVIWASHAAKEEYLYCPGPSSSAQAKETPPPRP